MPFARLAALVIILSGALLGAADQRDLIILKANDQKKLAIIESEQRDKLVIRATANSPSTTELRLHEVRSWEYVEMRDGYWAQATEARDQGRLAVAADLFNAMAASGTREWMKVYGAYQEGACWEMLADWPKAAEAFGRAAAVSPTHRLTPDAQYRQAFALARGRKDAEALKIADALAASAKTERNAGAEARSRAIRAVLAANAGNGELLKKEGRAAAFPREDAEVAVQFGAYFAEALRSTGMARDAKVEYERLLALPDLDPATRVPLRLGYAKVMADTDPGSALVELLAIDALPYGTPDAKCEVRTIAGRLLIAVAKEARAAGASDQATKDWIRDQERTARLLLSAAATSTSTSPSVAEAKGLLSAMGPDPDAPAAVPAPPK